MNLITVYNYVCEQYDAETVQRIETALHYVRETEKLSDDVVSALAAYSDFAVCIPADAYADLRTCVTDVLNEIHDTDTFLCREYLRQIIDLIHASYGEQELASCDE